MSDRKDPAVTERNNRLLNDWAAGMPMNEMIAKYGITRRYARVIACKARKCGDARAVLRDNPQHAHSVDVELAAKLRAGGDKYEYIGLIMGVSGSAVRSALIRNGLCP